MIVVPDEDLGINYRRAGLFTLLLLFDELYECKV